VAGLPPPPPPATLGGRAPCWRRQPCRRPGLPRSKARSFHENLLVWVETATSVSRQGGRAEYQGDPVGLALLTEMRSTRGAPAYGGGARVDQVRQFQEGSRARLCMTCGLVDLHRPVADASARAISLLDIPCATSTMTSLSPRGQVVQHRGGGTKTRRTGAPGRRPFESRAYRRKGRLALHGLREKSRRPRPSRPSPWPGCPRAR